ncbi:transferrin-binding protein-like solute binding protein [Sphingomonas sp.]|uniref:transferrin-binding protein-like solute binding protein n=1 Tax=Sphingomonas sp. TaxID=28214 RepID=UPI001EBA446F|nr:transferrin-binding protein-like solute binding protein [Sphingomonas sp.]MBX3594122.1 hypothetical protein [Sphingomonas sp.]
MIRRSVLIASTGVALTVAACGGGGSSSPTPTPTATATATPTPTPATYSTLPLAAATEFYSVSAAMSYTGDPTAGPVTLGTAGTDAFSTRVRLALQSTATASQTTETVVLENTEESRFTGADLATAPSTAVTEYVYRESSTPTTAGMFSQLDLLNNTITGSVTSNTALALSYASYAGWWRGDSTAGAKRVTYSTFGYPTVPTDMPTTGTVSYTVNVAGRSIVSPSTGASAEQKLAGTATVSINYATGLVTLTMNLTRGGVAYGSFSGTGAIAAGNNQFTGSFGTGSAAGGTFQGLAYGPQAAEIGITFAISGTVTGGDSRAVGVVVGKKS